MILLLRFAFLTLANCDPVQNLHYQDYFNSFNPVDFYQAPVASPIGSSFTPIENDGKVHIFYKAEIVYEGRLKVILLLKVYKYSKLSIKRTGRLST